MPASLSLNAGVAFGLSIFFAIRLAPQLPRRLVPRAVIIATVSLAVAGLGAAPVWRSLLDGYPGDSFATLSPLAGAGLAALSLVLIGLLFALSLAKTQCLERILVPTGGKAWFWSADLAASLALAYLALWLAPQAYYLYYLTIFDGLPWQSVIKPPPGPGVFLSILLLAEPASLSAHLQGLTARALLLASAARPFLTLVASTAPARSTSLWAGVLAGGLHAAGSAMLAATGF